MKNKKIGVIGMGGIVKNIAVKSETDKELFSEPNRSQMKELHEIIEQNDYIKFSQSPYTQYDLTEINSLLQSPQKPSSKKCSRKGHEYHKVNGEFECYNCGLKLKK